jgi:HAE1 family hydrophobic/amphiphilic exporter-1
VLEDRTSRDIKFLADNTDRFMAARRRPELTNLNTTPWPTSQVYVDVTRAGRSAGESVRRLPNDAGVRARIREQSVGSTAVAVWSEADSSIERAPRTSVNAMSRMQMVSAYRVRRGAYRATGPKFTIRYNGYRSAQIIASAAPG